MLAVNDNRATYPTPRTSVRMMVPHTRATSQWLLALTLLTARATALNSASTQLQCNSSAHGASAFTPRGARGMRSSSADRLSSCPVETHSQTGQQTTDSAAFADLATVSSAAPVTPITPVRAHVMSSRVTSLRGGGGFAWHTSATAAMSALSITFAFLESAQVLQGIVVLGSVPYKGFVYYNVSIASSMTPAFVLEQDITSDVRGWRGSIAWGARRCLCFCILPEAHARLHIDALVSCFSSHAGLQCDLFVSLGNTIPTQNSSDYKSVSQAWTASEAVELDSTSALWTSKCPPGGAPCNVIIGLYGEMPGNFTLLVTLNATSSLVALSPGLPSIVPPAFDLQYNWWSATFSIVIPPTQQPPPTSVTIDVTGLDDTDGIFVFWGSSLRGGVPNPSEQRVGFEPTSLVCRANRRCSQRHTFFVRNILSYDADNSSSYCSLWEASTINTNSFASYADGSDVGCWCGAGSGFAGTCIFYATVATYGFQAITATGSIGADAVVTLIDGVPASGTLTTGANRYYMFYPALSRHTSLLQTTVSITLTPSLGDADLFVTVDKSQPSTFNWDFASVRCCGPDFTYINISVPEVARYCNITAPAASPDACVFKIAVNGWSRLSSYTIVAQFSDYTLLLPGHPLFLSVSGPPPNEALFRINAQHPVDALALTLTPFAGSPIMAGGNDTTPSQLYPQPSVPGTYGWGPVGPGVFVQQPARPSDPLPTYYVAGVSAPAGAVSGVSFSLTASFQSPSGNGNMTLLIGLPALGAVSGGEYDRYQLAWPFVSGAAARQVTINMDGQTGYPWLLASIGSADISASRADYTSNWISVWGTITINANDPAVLRGCGGPPTPTCTIYVAIYGCPPTICTGGLTTPALYLLVALTTGSTLLDGVPQNAVVGYFTTTYFTFTAPSREAPFTVAVTPFAGDPQVR